MSAELQPLVEAHAASLSNQELGTGHVERTLRISTMTGMLNSIVALSEVYLTGLERVVDTAQNIATAKA